MPDRVILIFTVEGEDLILSRRWSGFWKANQRRAEKYKYVIFCQNLHKSRAAPASWSFATATRPHGTGFLLARLEGVVPSPEEEDRWNFKLGDFVRIDKPNIWKGWRFPLNYEHNLQDFDLDPNLLPFEPMPPPRAMEAPYAGQSVLLGEAKAKENKDRECPGALTIAEAKAGLALGLGVPETAIEITVRG
jgi:hypothetical protein